MIFNTQPTGFHPAFDVVACYVRYAGKFILLQRAAHKRQPLMWGVPAGKVDPGEAIVSAMQREVREEIGFDAPQKKLRMIESLCVRYDHADDSRYDFFYHVFLLDLDAQIVIRRSLNEHVDSRWVTPEEALELNLIHDLDLCIRRHMSMLRNEK